MGRMMEETEGLKVEVPRLVQCDDCKEFVVCIFENEHCTVLGRAKREPTPNDCIACQLFKIQDTLFDMRRETPTVAQRLQQHENEEAQG